MSAEPFTAQDEAEAAPLYPTGTYKAVVLEHGFSRADRGNGTPQLYIIVQLQSKVINGDTQPVDAVNKTIYKPITKQTATYLLSDLNRLFAFPHRQFGPLLTFELAGKPLTVYCKHTDRMRRDQNGEYTIVVGKREEWNWSIPGPVSIAAHEVQALDAELGLAPAEPKKPTKRAKAMAADL
jgi:hypothetical protein